MAPQDIPGTKKDEDEEEANANVWLIIHIWKRKKTCSIVFVCVFMSLSRGRGIKILALLIQTLFSPHKYDPCYVEMFKERRPQRAPATLCSRSGKHQPKASTLEWSSSSGINLILSAWDS